MSAPSPVSEAQLAANRANAQHSTGPKTEAGKVNIRLNAVKTGLTGCTVLLPHEDAAEYQAHILGYQKQFQPVGPEECALVQSIADIRWRLNRIPALEQSLLTLCHLDAAQTEPSCQTAVRTPLVEMEIRRKFAKEFRNLALQENRLSRRREKEMAELRELQKERKESETKALDEAAKVFLLAHERKQPFDLAAIGFDFSKDEIARYVALMRQSKRCCLLEDARIEAKDAIKFGVTLEPAA